MALLSILLFFFYLFAGLWWLRKDGFLARSGFTPLDISRLFLLKVVVACIYGYIGSAVYHNRFDTWAVFTESLKETDLLLHEPGRFFGELFQQFSLSSFKDSRIAFNGDFQGNFIIKAMALANLLSSRNYYINALFFSFVTVYGYAFFLRIYLLFRPEDKSCILLSSLLIPGFLFWGSGMYKEGVIFSGICILAYGCIMVFKQLKYAWFILVGILVLCLVRSYPLLLFSPVLFFYMVWTFIRKEKHRGFAGFLVLFLLISCAVVSLGGVYDFPAQIAAKRDAFLLLKGNSLLDPRPLLPDWRSLVERIPSALEYTFVRPFPQEAFRYLLYIPALIETLAVLLLFFMWLIRKGWKARYPAYITMLAVFAVLSMIVIGLTVPFLGAIVRYKSIYLPFLVTPVALVLYTKSAKTKVASGPL